MELIDVYVTGWGGRKSWPRAEGPGPGSRRLTAAFCLLPEARLGGVPWDLLQVHWKYAAMVVRGAG